MDINFQAKDFTNSFSFFLSIEEIFFLSFYLLRVLTGLVSKH